MEEREDLEGRVLKLEEKVPIIDANLNAFTKTNDEILKKLTLG